MVTCHTFHGLVDIQNASRYQCNHKNYWRHNNYIILPSSDLVVAVPEQILDYPAMLTVPGIPPHQQDLNKLHICHTRQPLSGKGCAV